MGGVVYVVVVYSKVLSPSSGLGWTQQWGPPASFEKQLKRGKCFFPHQPTLYRFFFPLLFSVMVGKQFN